MFDCYARASSFPFMFRFVGCKSQYGVIAHHNQLLIWNEALVYKKDSTDKVFNVNKNFNIWLLYDGQCLSLHVSV
jgi:hypothetical protein